MVIEVPQLLFALKIALKPSMLRRRVIEDSIVHQVTFNRLDIRPVAELIVDFLEVNNREASI